MTKDKRLHETNVCLNQTEQNLAAHRAALITGASLAGDLYRTTEKNLQQSMPDMNVAGCSSTHAEPAG